MLLVEDGLEVVTRERADRVLRLPEAHGQELGAIAVVSPEDVEALVAGSLPRSASAGFLDVFEKRVGVLTLRPASPGASDHTSFNAVFWRRIPVLTAPSALRLFGPELSR